MQEELDRTAEGRFNKVKFGEGQRGAERCGPILGWSGALRTPRTDVEVRLVEDATASGGPEVDSCIRLRCEIDAEVEVLRPETADGRCRVRNRGDGFFYCTLAEQIPLTEDGRGVAVEDNHLVGVAQRRCLATDPEVGVRFESDGVAEPANRVADDHLNLCGGVEFSDVVADHTFNKERPADEPDALTPGADRGRAEPARKWDEVEQSVMATPRLTEHVGCDALREGALSGPVVGKRMKVHALTLRNQPELRFVSDRCLTGVGRSAEDGAIHFADARSKDAHQLVSDRRHVVEDADEATLVDHKECAIGGADCRGGARAVIEE